MLVRTWLLPGRAVEVSLGPQQLVHADGEVSPLRRCTSAAEKAEHEHTHQRPLRGHCVQVQQRSLMLATAGFEGSVELMEGGLVIRSLNSRAMPRKTSTSALAEETKIHFCIYPSPRRRPKHHDAIDAKVGFLQFARPAGPADARVGAWSMVRSYKQNVLSMPK